ncbi:MAG: DUF547 domain-containing protein [Rhodopirellula sp.]|nr:DUF547 domain-containing protein [Rhodopirellula sp.]
MKLTFSFAGMAVLAFVAFVTGTGSDAARAGDPVWVGQNVRGTTSMDQIDHSPWDRLLKKYVDDDGYVNYKAWHASSTDRQALTGYLNSLSRVNPQAKADNDAKFAFWINAYNAVTVHGILREYPTSSIRNHTAKLFGYNIWKDLKLIIGGQGHSLEHIEHQVLRKMGDPRIHFAIVCASIGCPRLLNEAYTADKLQAQLDINAKDFFNREQNFRYDARGGRFHMSSILSWFGEDFGGNQAAQLRTVSKWLPDRASQTAAQRGTGSISFMDYNWNLNDQSSRRVARR